MDFTVFVWIFVIIFFLIYTTVQAKKCCSAMNKLSSTDSAQQQNETTTASAVYTIGDSGRHGTPNCRVNLSVRDIDRILYANNPDSTTVSIRDHHRILYDGLDLNDESKKDDGLPTYEEVIAQNNSNNNNQIAAVPSAVPSLSATSPSVVINIEARITPT